MGVDTVLRRAALAAAARNWDLMPSVMGFTGL